MKKINADELADELEQRPQLAQFLERHKKDGKPEMWLLNVTPTTPEAEKAAKKTLMLAVTYHNNKFLLSDTKGGKDKSDRLLAYILNYREIANFASSITSSSAATDGKQYVMIPRDKIGRPKRELNEDEKAQITAWRTGEERLTINEIAKRLHVANRLVMEYTKSL